MDSVAAYLLKKAVAMYQDMEPIYLARLPVHLKEGEMSPWLRLNYVLWTTRRASAK